MRDNFVFYRSFYEAIGELPREMQLEVLLDLINYALNAVEPQSSGMAKAVFILMRPQIDANNKKYENGKKGGEHGKKGGRPPNDKQDKDSPEPRKNPREATGEPPKNPLGVSGKTPNVNDNDNVNVNENVNANDIPPCSPPSGGKGERCEQDNRATTGAKTPLEESFKLFWTAYPKKRSKGAAQKAWAKVRPDSSLLAAILEAIAAQKRSEAWQKQGGQYIPYPATWLNARGWEDEMEAESHVGQDTPNGPIQGQDYW